MAQLLQIALGGAIGAVLRYLAVTQVTVLLGAGFPFGTLCVNVVGSLAMGVLAAMMLSWPAFSGYSPLILTGLLGGFTTFSAFSLDTVRLFEAGQVVSAMTYILASVILSIGALAIGYFLTKGVMA